MQIDFLVIDEKEAYLLGFELKLSKTRHRLLYEIAAHGELSADELLALLDKDVSRGNVAVHISAINRAAKDISERKLVIYEKHKYKLNPFM